MSISTDTKNIENHISNISDKTSDKKITNEKQCYICGNKTVYSSIFKGCNHYYCIYCLFRTLFLNNIKEFINQNEISVNCKCKTGKMKLTLNEIKELWETKSKEDEKILTAKSKEDKIEDNETIKYICNNHKSKCDLFCKDCEKYICSQCKDEEHNNHITVSTAIYVRMYKDFIKGMPLKYKFIQNFKLNLDKSIEKFNKDLSKQTNSFVKQITHLIEELNEIKKNYLTRLREIQDNGLVPINLINNFYYEYYQDLSNMNNDNDIYSLRYLAHFKYELENFNLIYNEDIFDKLKKIQNQIIPLKNSTENAFSIEANYVEVPTTLREVTRTLGHANCINCLTKIGDNQFISGSADNTIKFWNLDDEDLKPYDCFNQFTGEVALVLLLKDNRLCTSPEKENWIKIFEKIKTYNESDSEVITNNHYKVLSTLSKHSNVVSAIIELDNNLLVSAARDGYIIIWEFQENNFKEKVSTQVCKEGVYSLCKLQDNRFASGSADGEINFWKIDVETVKDAKDKNQCKCILIKKLEGHKNKIRCLILLNNNNLCSGDDSGIVIIWKKINNETYEKSWQKEIKGEIITCMTSIKHGFLIIGSYEPKHPSNVYLRVWESKNDGYEEKEVIRKHYKPIRSVIELDLGNIVSAGDDGVIIIWKTGVLDD